MRGNRIDAARADAGFERLDPIDERECREVVGHWEESARFTKGRRDAKLQSKDLLGVWSVSCE